MSHPLVDKLAAYVDLDDADRGALERLGENARELSGGDLVRQGERPEAVQLLLEGWAYRYKVLPDGRRQIVAYLIPGDLCDIQIFVLARMDHSIGLLGPARVAAISPKLMLDTLDRYPRIARALWWATLVDEATLREWLVNMGRREPYERIAHLLCEMGLRMGNVGLVTDGRFALPLTQAELGDTMGLTTVTVNRVLQRLRFDGLITLQGGQLRLLDPARLRAACGFDPDYLHGALRSSEAMGPKAGVH